MELSLIHIYMGLLKMDFLGLRTLTVISKAKANIKKNFGIDIDPDKIPFDDPKIFERCV